MAENVGTSLFYEKVSRLCAKFGVSPSKMAIDIGMAKGTMSAWKRGGGVTNPAAMKVAVFFDVTVDDLINDNVPAEEVIKKCEVKNINNKKGDGIMDGKIENVDDSAMAKRTSKATDLARWKISKFGCKLVSLCRKKGVDRATFLRDIKAGSDAIPRWYADGTHPNDKFIKKIISYFGITESELFKEEPTAALQHMMQKLEIQRQKTMDVLEYILDSRSISELEDIACDIYAMYEDQSEENEARRGTNRLLSIYAGLNSIGKSKLLENAEDLLVIPKYVDKHGDADLEKPDTDQHVA
jgi:transcriptional regulator with XRE-family HTH domain